MELTLSALGTRAFTKSNAVEFLANASLKKDGADRLFSWLVQLDIVKSVTQSSLLKLYNNYQTMISRYFTDIEKPLDDLTESQKQIILADIPRSINWFEMIADEAEIPKEERIKAEEHVYRVLAAVVMTDDLLDYTQGYDRFAFVSYTLGLSFTVKLGIAAEFGEAMAYYLTREMIKLVKVWDVLEHLQEKEKDFIELDKMVSDVAPEVAESLDSHGSFHYALKWRLLMFADDHKLADLLIIWDSIFLRKKEFNDYMTDLMLAHIRQVKPDPSVIMIERIQKYKDWDAEAILQFANKRCTMRAIKNGSKTLLKFAGAGIVLAAAYYINKTLRKG